MIKEMAHAIHHTVKFGDFDIYVIRDEDKDHVVLIKGNINQNEDILCRISSECLPGTALFSAECDCKQQIEFSMRMIAKEGKGILIYLRQEGRGLGLITKIHALANKNKGMDTFEAVEALGLPTDVRKYSVVKQILDYFGICSIRCLSNNPDKINALEKEGIIVRDVVNIPIIPNAVSLRHLQAKKNRGHAIIFTESGQSEGKN